MNQMKPLHVEFVWLTTDLIFNESMKPLHVEFVWLTTDLIFNESNKTFTLLKSSL